MERQQYQFSFDVIVKSILYFNRAVGHYDNVQV